MDFTHIHTDMKSIAVHVHFLVNERLVLLVAECRVLHSGDNMSRHSPIPLKLRVGDIPIRKKVCSSVPRRTAWNKATQENIEQYKDDLKDKLDEMLLPDSMSCVDSHCRDPAHSSDRESVMLDVLCSVIESSHNNIC